MEEATSKWRVGDEAGKQQELGSLPHTPLIAAGPRERASSAQTDDTQSRCKARCDHVCELERGMPTPQSTCERDDQTSAVCGYLPMTERK